MKYLGDYTNGSLVSIFFGTNNSAGGAIAPSSGFASDDIIIYKNDSATQKSTTNGITMNSPFDSITGLHLVTLDTSNNSGDASFWEASNDYSAILSPDDTVDGQTIVHPLAQFSIENRNDSANVTKLNSDAQAATNLSASALQIIIGAIDTGTNSHTPTTTEFQSDSITETTVDHFNGRVIIFKDGPLSGQATDITAYSGVGGIGQFTVTALTESPADNNTFVIV